MLCPQLPVYGLDIETDTATDGLNPAVSSVVAVAVCTAAGAEVMTGSEADVLRDTEAVMAALPTGVFVTWNGSGFDLPFLVDRSRAAGVPLGLDTRLDRSLHTRSPLPGHAGSYRGNWHGHRHLDAYRVYRNDLRRLLDMSCSLKSIAGFVGLDAVEFDAARVHELSRNDLRSYVASDARLARLLALRRWPTAAPFIDQLAAV